MSTALAGIGLVLVHQLAGPALTADRFVDPEIRDVQPAAPDAAEQAPQGLASRTLREEVNGVVARQAGHPDVEHVEAIAHQLRLGAARLVKDDCQVALRFQSQLRPRFLEAAYGLVDGIVKARPQLLHRRAALGKPARRCDLVTPDNWSPNP